jgi:hypothetical protein
MAIPGANCHSFWSFGAYAFYVDYDTLYQVTGPAEALDKAVVRTGLTPGLPVSYDIFGSDVFWSNGVVIERISNGVSYPALPVPRTSPSVVADATGSFPGGLYQYAITYRSADGEESGATYPEQITVPDGGRLVFSSFPVAPAGAAEILLYLSPTNGDLLYRVAALPTSVINYMISLPALGGPQLRTMFLTPLPPGQILRVFNGRLLVASGGDIHYTDPYDFAHYNPVKNVVPFTERVTLMEPCQNGVYVSADQTYWFRGTDFAKADPDPVHPYRAVEGTAGQIPNANSCYWFSERGVIIGDQQGQVKNVQEEHVAVDPATFGAGLFREQDGMKQIVTTLFNPSNSVAAAKSWMDAEVIRKENL